MYTQNKNVLLQRNRVASNGTIYICILPVTLTVSLTYIFVCIFIQRKMGGLNLYGVLFFFFCIKDQVQVKP